MGKKSSQLPLRCLYVLSQCNAMVKRGTDKRMDGWVEKEVVKPGFSTEMLTSRQIVTVWKNIIATKLSRMCEFTATPLA